MVDFITLNPIDPHYSASIPLTSMFRPSSCTLHAKSGIKYYEPCDQQSSNRLERKHWTPQAPGMSVHTGIYMEPNRFQKIISAFCILLPQSSHSPPLPQLHYQ